MLSKNMRRLVLIGAPGVGKGDLVRTYIRGDQVESKQIRQFVDEGKLIPDDLVVSMISKAVQNSSKQGYIFDGFPRSAEQAKYLLSNKLADAALEISLDMNVSVAKILGRAQCTTCKKDFNTCDIRDGEYDMPAILPNKSTCALKDKCQPVLSKRSDDNEITVLTRFREYERETLPVLEVLRNHSFPLKTFVVKKGVADIDALEAMALKILKS